MRGPIKLAPVGLGWRIGSGNQRHDDFRASPYTGCRFPPEIISHSVWLYFRFRLRLRMVEEMLAARGIRCLFGDRKVALSVKTRRTLALTQSWWCPG
jgi:putative transposase